MKRTALKRSSQPRSAARSAVPGRAAWKTPRWGVCPSCGLRRNQPLHGHHVIPRQTVARHGGDEYDPRNRLDVCADCHLSHEFGMVNRKLSRALIPEAAVEFAVELLGEELAMLHFLRHYREVEAA